MSAAGTEALRERFHLPAGAYWLNHSVGCQPRGTAGVFEREALAPWRAEGEAWEHWLGCIQAFNTLVAQLIGSRAELICPQVNLSSALAKILPALPARADRPVLLLSREDWPSLGFVLQRFAAQRGLTMRYLPAGQDPADAATWAAALTDDVHLALLTHVQSTNGRRLPVADITGLCRARAVWSVVDVAQSAGVIPIDVGQWQADFVLGSCVKWLCGGPGAGWLAVDAAACAQCEPSDVGWFSHADPFEFRIEDFRYAEGAARFWGGTPSVWPCIVAAEGLRTLLEIGIDTVAAHNRRLTEALIAALPAGTLACPADSDRRGGTLVVDLGDNAAAAARLNAAGFACDFRRHGVRFSAHVYNTLTEVEHLAAAIAAGR